MFSRGNHTRAPRNKRSIPALLAVLGGAAALCVAPMLAASPAVATENPVLQRYPWPDGDPGTAPTQAPVHNGGLDTASVVIGAVGGITATGVGMSINSAIRRRRERILMRDVW